MAVPTLEPVTLSNHVVIAGFGLGGRNLARVLRSAHIDYVITELNGATVREARRAGEPMIFGDVSRASVLEQCRAESAQTLVFLLSDDRATRRAVRVARQLNPDVFILARARQLADIEILKDDGANEVIAQEFESSIEIVTRVLERFHVPRNVINTQEHLLRADGYAALRSRSAPRGVSENVARALAAGTTDTFLITESHLAAGRTIRELDVRRKTGATIIAVVHEDEPFTNPPSEFRLQAGHVLVLVGDHAAIERAFVFLEQAGEEE
jgi:CPA2 family monovalent cation:H+ antiporter-2